MSQTSQADGGSPNEHVMSIPPLDRHASPAPGAASRTGESGMPGDSPGCNGPVVGHDWMGADSPPADVSQDEDADDNSVQGSGWGQLDDDSSAGVVPGSGWDDPEDESRTHGSGWDDPDDASTRPHWQGLEWGDMDVLPGVALATGAPTSPVAGAAAPAGSPANAPKPDQVEATAEPIASDVAPPGSVGDPLEDRDVLEFALFQRGCLMRRVMRDLPRRACSRSDPCEDCALHDGAYVPASFWDDLPRETLERRLDEYLRNRHNLPVWRSRRLPTLHMPRVRFDGPAEPPSPSWLRETTPEPPIFRTTPPLDGLNNDE